MAAKSGFKKWIVVLTVISAAILELIDVSIVNVALFQISGNLGVNIEDVAWVITSYAIANVIIIPLTGFMAKYFGRKNYFITSIIVFTVSSYFCGASQSLWELVAFRFIQGLGGGALLSVSQGILFDSFEEKERPIASAIFGMGIVMGPTFGPTLGGYIIEHLTWHWIFYINIPIGILAVLLSWMYVEKQPDEHKIDRKSMSIDRMGILLLAVGLGCLQFVLERGDAKDWFDSNVIKICTAIAVVGLFLFVWWELKIKHPVVPLRVLRNRNLAVSTFLTFFVGYGLFTSVFVYPVLVQRIIGFTALQTGITLIPGTLVTILIMPIIGISLKKGYSPRNWVILGILIFIGFTWLMSTATDQAPESFFINNLYLRGLGISMLTVPLINQAVVDLKPSEMPFGIAMTNMIRQLGGACGIAVTNTFIHRRLAEHKNELLSQLDATDPAVMERFNQMVQGMMAQGYGLQDAQTLAYRLLDGQVTKQVYLLAYLDAFKLAAVFFIVVFPLVFLLKNKPVSEVAAKEAAEAH
jgi:MFS transporter, DHA2 family, multidrug resistance protein